MPSARTFSAMERLPDLLMRDPRVAPVGFMRDLQDDDLITGIDRRRGGTTVESAETGKPPLLPAGVHPPVQFPRSSKIHAEPMLARHENRRVYVHRPPRAG